MPPCGRSACSLGPDQYRKKVSSDVRPVHEWRDQSRYRPSYNVGPTQWAPVMYQECVDGVKRTVLHTMKWGLVPSFGPVDVNTCNARCETLTQKPVFRNLLSSKRCVVLHDGFYEWQKTATSKKPFFVRLDKPINQDARDVELCSLLPMAGLYDVWHDPQSGEDLYSYTVITTDAAPEFQAIHCRCPCILDTPEAIDMWLDCQRFPFEAVKYLLRPHSGFYWYPVAPLVGNIRNNTPQCLKLFDEKSGIGKFFTPNADKSEALATGLTDTATPQDQSPPAKCCSLLPQTETTSRKEEPAVKLENEGSDVKTSLFAARHWGSPAWPKRMLERSPGASSSPPPRRPITTFFKPEPK